MAKFTIIYSTRIRNTVNGNPMYELTLAEIVDGVQSTSGINCRNKPNSGFVYGVRLAEGADIEGTLHTTPSGRVYLTDAKNI